MPIEAKWKYVLRLMAVAPLRPAAAWRLCSPLSGGKRFLQKSEEQRDDPCHRFLDQQTNRKTNENQESPHHSIDSEVKQTRQQSHTSNMASEIK
ncbi:hypothetical protein AOLI_G00310600 [Acnodon oligacanthus]